MKNSMILSNIFLLIPILISVYKSEWLFFAFSLGLIIVSPFYHYLRSYREKSRFFFFAKESDWSIALAAYIYMFYFIHTKIEMKFQILLDLMLISTIIFFWYGFKYRREKYAALHPWFHFFAQMTAGLIIYLAR